MARVRSPLGVQIMPQQDLGEQIGAGFGSGLGQGLQALLEQKAQQLQQRGQVGGLQALGQLTGQQISSEQAEALAQLDPRLQQQLFKQLGQGQQLAAQSQFLEKQGIPPEVLSLPPQAQAAFIKQFGKEKEESGIEAILGKMSQKDQDFQLKENLSNVSTPKEALKDIKDLTDKEAFNYKMAPGARALKETEALREALESEKLSNSEKSKLRREIERREERFEKLQTKVDDKTEPFFNEIKDQQEAGREASDRLDEQLRLIETGKLPNALIGSLADFLDNKIGINIKGLFSGEAQEFDKISKDFLRDAKKYFGARVTQGEINLFLQRIPTLSQSNEGKIRVINTLKHFYDASQVKNDIMEAIIDENKGYRPPNLKSLVEKRSKPVLDQLSKEFKTGALRPEVEQATASAEDLGQAQAFRKSPLGTIARGVGSLGALLGL